MPTELEERLPWLPDVEDPDAVGVLREGGEEVGVVGRSWARSAGVTLYMESRLGIPARRRRGGEWDIVC